MRRNPNGKRNNKIFAVVKTYSTDIQLSANTAITATSYPLSYFFFPRFDRWAFLIQTFVFPTIQIHTYIPQGADPPPSIGATTAGIESIWTNKIPPPPPPRWDRRAILSNRYHIMYDSECQAVFFHRCELPYSLQAKCWIIIINSVGTLFQW